MKSALAIFLILRATFSLAADWPEWRGPNRDGISREKIALAWPEGGPKVVWRGNVGTGFSSVAISHHRAITLGNHEDQDSIFCFDARNGHELWRHTYPALLGPQYYEGGPAATATIHQGKVYSISKWGDVFCLDAATGQVVWQRDLRKDAIRPNRWGFAGSPLIWNDLVIFNAGEGGTALNRKNGKIAWSNGTNTTGYASPVLFHSKREVLIFGAKHLIAVEAATGRERWRFPWETGWDTNNPDPLVYDNKIFISSFTAGCALLDARGTNVTPIYHSKSMHNHLSPGVLIDGYLYGFSGEAKHETDFRCLKIATGEVEWIARDPGMGSVVAEDNKLVVLSEKGELMVGDTNPKGWSPRARAQILGGLCWTAPSIADGFIYARNAKGDLVCLDLREPIKP